MAVEAALEGLILWDPDLVLDWMRRNETYARLRSRASTGVPVISAQSLGEILRVVWMRSKEPARLDEVVAEIREQFTGLDLTLERSESYARVVEDCRRTLDRDVSHEAWFAWQVALCRREGYRIMTKASQRYRGLVDPGLLA